MIGNRKAFFVEEYPEDFDPYADPRDGQQYLQQVRWEASQCDAVATAVIDEAKMKRRSIVNVLPGCEKVPPLYLIDLDGQLDLVADFSAVRQRISKLRELIQSHCIVQAKLPPIRDRQSWYKICVEYTIAPLLSVVLPMPQTLVVWLLEVNAEWLSKSEELSNYQGRWVYALMACLELPPSPNSHSSLRVLARACARIRAQHVRQGKVDLIASPTLLICIVAHYFRQLDLADIVNE